MGGTTYTKTGGVLSVGMRASAVLFTTLLTLLLAAPALAADPVRRDGTAPKGSVEPTGVETCDVRLSVVDGPLVDFNFSVRIYEPFIIWGFGYPADAEINLEFHSVGITTFTTMTDSAGEFADGLYTFEPGSQDGYLVAYPFGGCDDTISSTCWPRTRSAMSPASSARSAGSTAKASPEAARRRASARAMRSRAVRWPPS